ncbi:MAG: (d)CMP kinase [Candidatus Thorarchaeota archaeon]
MIIAISGLHGTGKSTIAKLLAEKLGLQYYSTGEIFREFAKKKNMSLEEFSKYVENHPEIDRELDEKTIEKAKEDNIIIDSQLSGHILNSIADFKIHLKCSLESRVKRMTDRDESSFQKKLKETLLRETSELKRYKELYNIDLSDINTIYALHDLVIDTENLSVEEVLEKIISKFKEAKNKKP